MSAAKDKCTKNFKECRQNKYQWLFDGFIYGSDFQPTTTHICNSCWGGFIGNLTKPLQQEQGDG